MEGTSLIDFSNIIFLGGAGIVVIFLVAMKLAGFPIYQNPYGKNPLKTKRLNRNCDGEQDSEALIWRFDAIDDSNEKFEVEKDEKLKEDSILTGEFGEGMRKTVEYSLNLGRSVTAISGPIEDESERLDLLNFLDEQYSKHPLTFQYYMAKSRPELHFSILGDKIYAEDKHEKGKKEGAYGIWEAYSEYQDKFYHKFELAQEPPSVKVSHERVKQLIAELNK
jgi:hypothetical protein